MAVASPASAACQCTNKQTNTHTTAMTQDETHVHQGCEEGQAEELGRAEEGKKQEKSGNTGRKHASARTGFFGPPTPPAAMLPSVIACPTPWSPACSSLVRTSRSLPSTLFVTTRWEHDRRNARIAFMKAEPWEWTGPKQNSKKEKATQFQARASFSNARTKRNGKKFHLVKSSPASSSSLCHRARDSCAPTSAPRPEKDLHMTVKPMVRAGLTKPAPFNACNLGSATLLCPCSRRRETQKASAALSVGAVEDDCLHTVDFGREGNGEIDMKGERKGDRIDKKVRGAERQGERGGMRGAAACHG